MTPVEPSGAAPAAPGLYAEWTAAEAAGGRPATLVAMVHGSMDRHTSFARLRARLISRYDTCIYDRRGYAASRDLRPLAYGIGTHVDDLEALLAGRRAILVGHSYGGDVALAYAERRPELVDGVLAFEPPMPWLDLWHGDGPRPGGPPWAAATPEAAGEAFVRRMVGEQRYERIPAATRAELRKDGPALLAEMADIRSASPPFDPTEVTARVIVACGGESAERHLLATTWLAAELPRGEHRVVPGAGHGGHRSHSRELADLVDELADGAEGEPR